MAFSKTCPVCGNPFVSKASVQKFCSSECFHKSKGYTVECTCDICQKPFMRTASKVKAKNYCSPQCTNIARRGSKILCTCATCGRQFSRVPSRVNEVNFCSVECKDKSAIKSREYICPVCGKTFIRVPSQDRFTTNFCSQECCGKSQQQRVEIVCATCGKTFTRTAATVGKFCSTDCYGRSMEQKIQSICATCGKPFDHWPSQDRQFCSSRCKLSYAGPTSIEIATQQALDNLSIDYTSQYKIGRYHIDFFLHDLDVCLEVDGDYWHSLLETKARDQRRDKHLTNCGYKVVRISESDINTAECVTTLVAQRLGLID